MPLGSSFLWSTGAVTSSIYVKSEGIYSVSITNASPCIIVAAPTLIHLNTRLSDFDRSGITSVSDFLSMVALFNLSCSNCPHDLNYDGVVNVSDFLFFVTEFGLSCN
ncbi:MAG: hypothetical protein IPO63_16525 [Bacteroidetes bacterium]|nr:hypothetical protein [Bacteroidota bacterium]